MSSHYQITLLPGDGIGVEVVAAAQEVLLAVAQKFQFSVELKKGLIGHAAIEATGNPLPDETLATCQASQAVLLGAVGHPMYDNDPSAKVRPEQGLLKIRKELGLFANLRPIQVFDELLFTSSLKPEILKGADILFFRELTGGIYFGQPRERRENGTVALDTMIYAKYEIERIAHMAFVAAQRRNKKLCSVDKANVLESSRLWRETVHEVAKQYPDVALSDMFVDNAAMQLIKNPKQFDVILTENMFGDILTDEASQIAGSLGLLPSASLGNKIGLYEPVHGSAPDIAGKGLANPVAAILSVALMLETSFQQTEAAKAIRRAIATTYQQGYRTADLVQQETPTDKILNTEKMTQQILSNL